MTAISADTDIELYLSSILQDLPRGLIKVMLWMASVKNLF